jgi:branched-chain amino acid transport system permease protein
MGFSELMNNLPILGGPLGIRNIPPITVFSMRGDAVQSALVLLIPGVVFGVILQNLVGEKAHWGKILHWVRDDDVSARTFGIVPERWRIAIFTVHAMLAALSGLSMVIAQGYISPRSFDLWMSIEVLTVVYLSGTGGNPVAMYVGAAVLVMIGEFLRSFGELPQLVGPVQQIVTTAILIAILSFRRRGLAGPIIEAGPSAARLE